MNDRIVLHPPSKATNGTYTITVSYYVGNIRKQKRKSGFTRSKDAKAYGEDIKKKLLEEMPVIKATGGESISFKELAEKIIELRKTRWTSNSLTIRQYSLKHCDFLEVKLNQLTSLIIESNLMRLSKIYKYGTVSSINASFNFFLNAAVEYDLLLKNPNKTKIQKPKKTNTIKALPMEKITILLEEITDETIRLFTLIGATCGLRQGELLDLNMSDFDFKRGLLSVSHQYAIHNGKRERGRPLKTSNSYRTIPVPQGTLSAIKSFPIVGINGELFTNTISHLDDDINRMYKQLGYKISCHSLRHSYITNLIASNRFDIQSIAKMAGDTVETILKTYSHYLEKTQEENIEKINNLFG